MTMHHASTSQTARLTRGTVLLLAVTCGIAVGTIYFPQAVSPLVADGLHVPPAAAALVVTATQLGYTAGIFLLVPLADRVPHRTLIVTLLALSGLSLLAAGAAPGLAVLVAASALVGTTTVAAQVIAPMAAGLVPENRRGVVTGTLLSGSIGGILLARAFAGILGESAGWRAPYLVAALLVLLLAAVLARTLPTTTPPSAQPYVAVLAEPLRLLRNEPELRRSAFYQATVFCGFSAIWTTIALLLTGPAYQLGTGAVGLLALVGAGTMVTTPIAGRQVDRHGPDPVNLVALLGVLAAAGVLALGVVRGAVGLAALTAGTLLLDVAMQAGMVANQTRIWALRAEIRGRLNTAYMSCAYLGGTAGSWLGAQAYTRYGWSAVCALLAGLTAAALIRHLRPARTTASSCVRPALSLQQPTVVPLDDRRPDGCSVTARSDGSRRGGIRLGRRW